MISRTSSLDSPRSSLVAGLLSAILPGLGQIYARRTYRGAAVFLSTLITVLTVVWYGAPAWYLVPVSIWLWNIFDSASLAQGRPRSSLVPLAAILVMGYGIGWQVTGIDPSALTKNLDRATSIIRPMMSPDFVAHRETLNTGWVEVQVPCGPTPPPAVNAVNGIDLRLSPDCGNLNEVLILQASGLWPNNDTEVSWVTPIGDTYLLGENNTAPLHLTTDADGKLNAAIRVPPHALSAAPDPTLPLAHRVYLIRAAIRSRWPCTTLSGPCSTSCAQSRR
ncbi:MAG: hypothetical protein HY023_08095 [Chloroflexi bacterium]|nr:hypothetical protein [Chloroflexota bacterium]